jgi:beta-galactosidase
MKEEQSETKTVSPSRIGLCGLLILHLFGCNGAGYEGPVVSAIVPAITEVTDGDKVTFTAVSRLTTGVNYSWGKVLPNGTGAIIPEFTGPSLVYEFSVNDNQIYLSLDYTAKGESPGALITNKITVKPKPITFAAPLPPSIVVASGNGLRQQASLNYATAPIAYQWSKNGQPISGQTTSILTLPALTKAENGAQITLTATNSAGSVTSTVMTLIVQ